MSFLPHTSGEEKAMLAQIGVSSLDELFGDIPPELLLKRPLRLPAGLAEKEAWDKINELAQKNKSAQPKNQLLK